MNVSLSMKKNLNYILGAIIFFLLIILGIQLFIFINKPREIGREILESEKTVSYLFEPYYQMGVSDLWSWESSEDGRSVIIQSPVYKSDYDSDPNFTPEVRVEISPKENIVGLEASCNEYGPNNINEYFINGIRACEYKNNDSTGYSASLYLIVSDSNVYEINIVGKESESDYLTEARDFVNSFQLI